MHMIRQINHLNVLHEMTILMICPNTTSFNEIQVVSNYIIYYCNSYK